VAKKNISPNLNYDPTGYYTYKGVYYKDKLSAMVACGDSGDYPEFHFFEVPDKSFDWQKEPPGTLKDWYKNRALQLRENYDRVLLMFSGGIDSLVMLHSFIDNDIPIDGIFSYGAYDLPQWEKYKRNMELYQVAIPYMNFLRKSGKLKCEYYLLDDTKYNSFFDQDHWLEESYNNFYSPEALFHGQYYKEGWIQDHCEKGSTVVLRGVDKPRVIYDQGKWKLMFLDTASFSLVNPWRKSHDNLYYDFFYWSVDMPSLVSKQAHTIKNYFQDWDTEDPQFQTLFSKEGNVYNQKKYLEYVEPIIYNGYVVEKPGQPRGYFSIGKTPDQNFWHKDDVFLATGTARQKSSWFNGLKQVSEIIPSRFYGSPTPNVFTFINRGVGGIFAEEIILGQKENF
jgi:hypothetical protein